MNAAEEKHLRDLGVPVLVENERGCGFRKGGGYYLRSDGKMAPCGKLPMPVGICPTCGAGIRFSRAPYWVTPEDLFVNVKCRWLKDFAGCRDACPLNDYNLSRMGKALMIWVGERHYKLPSDFMGEAELMGISRRLKSVPRDFELGHSWVLLAHKRAMIVQENGKTEYKQGIFQVFKPDRIEYVCTGEEDEETIARLRKRDIIPVIVKRAGEPAGNLLGDNQE